MNTLSGYVVGSRICWPAISSTSKKRGTALDFAIKKQPSVLFEITNADGRDISKLSSYRENECY